MKEKNKKTIILIVVIIMLLLGEIEFNFKNKKANGWKITMKEMIGIKLIKKPLLGRLESMTNSMSNTEFVTNLVENQYKVLKTEVLDQYQVSFEVKKDDVHSVLSLLKTSAY